MTGAHKHAYGNDQAEEGGLHDDPPESNFTRCDAAKSGNGNRRSAPPAMIPVVKPLHIALSCCEQAIT